MVISNGPHPYTGVGVLLLVGGHGAGPIASRRQHAPRANRVGLVGTGNQSECTQAILLRYKPPA